MKILKNKTYNRLVEGYAPAFSARTYKQICEDLRIELKEAKDLKAILEKLYPLYDFSKSLRYEGGGNLNIEEMLPDNVLVYVDDVLGGKVIKQEGIKCLIIDKDGNVKTGLTKQKADKGYSYKLVRE